MTTKPNPDKKRCSAKSKRTGEQCNAWAVRGYSVCRMHGAGGATPEVIAARRATLKPGYHHDAPPPPPPPKGNQRARKHGAYSARVMPDEQAVYEEIKARFEEELGADNLTAADQRLIHQLSVVSAKFDLASEKGAPPDALQMLNRMVLDLLRELKATRASKDSVAQMGNTPADVMAALFLKVSQRSLPDPADRAIPVEATVVEVLPEGEDEKCV